jgi:LAO/AO transport system kinase
MLDELLDRFRRGDRLALARLLTLAARGQSVGEIRAALGPPAKPARVLVVTGTAGVGKSTLVGKLIEPIRESGQRVAVLACDPQSPLSGGALLGDRIRMPARPDDDGVFIRSLATASVREQWPAISMCWCALVEALALDVVLIENCRCRAGRHGSAAPRRRRGVTVAAGDGRRLAVGERPGCSVADVVVVQKADLPGSGSRRGTGQGDARLSGSTRSAGARVSAKTGRVSRNCGERWQGLPLHRRRGGRTANCSTCCSEG